ASSACAGSRCDRAPRCASPGSSDPADALLAAIVLVEALVHDPAAARVAPARVAAHTLGPVGRPDPVGAGEGGEVAVAVADPGPEEDCRVAVLPVVDQLEVHVRPAADARR